MKKSILILLMLFSLNCLAEPEEMIQVFREYDREKMLKLFKSEGIPYKLINENQIYYPLSYREKVKKVQRMVWGPLDESKKGVSVNIKVAPTLASKLVELKIPFKVLYNDEKTSFTWQAIYNEKAMEAVNEVVE